MGTQGGGDAGNWPADALPGLPPDWGPIVIPDDPAELAAEAELVRAELVRAELRRRHRLRRLLGPDLPGRHSVRLPASLLVVMLFATVAGLFFVSRAGDGRPNDEPAAGSAGAPADLAFSAPDVLPALDLLDPAGRAVSLRSLLPAVILLTDGCGCADLISATARAAPPGAAVLVVARQAPSTPPGVSGAVRPLADPTGELRSLLGLPEPTGRAGAADRAGVLVVNDSADIVHALPAVDSVNRYRVALSRLEAA